MQPSKMTPRELYRQANDSYHAGRLEQAAERFRSYLLAAPSDEKAQWKLAGIVMQLAREDPDRDSRLRGYREAMSLAPDLPKLMPRFVAHLIEVAQSDFARGDWGRARRLLDEAVTLRPTDARLRSLRCLAVNRQPLLPPGPTAGPTLVVVEWGVDIVVLQAMLHRLRPCRVVTQKRLQVVADSSIPISALADIGDVGPAPDEEICRTTDPIAATLRRTLKEAVPERAHLFELLSHELDDQAFAAGRRLRTLLEVLDPQTFANVLFVIGDDRLNRACLDTIVGRFGPHRVFRLWCSRIHNRYEDEPRLCKSLPPPAPATVREQSVRLPPEPAAQARGGVLVVVSASAIYADNLRRIVEAMPDRVTVLPVAPEPTRWDRLRTLTDLARREPDRVTVDARLCVRPRLEALDQGLLSQVRAALGDATMWGTTAWPLLEPIVTDLVSRRLPMLDETTARLRRFLRGARPDVLLIGPDRPAEMRAAVEGARDLGIPSLYPQTSLLSSSPRYRPLEADFATVVDRWTRDLLNEHFETPPSRVFMTGIPRFDDAVRCGLNGRADRHTVVLALQRFSLARTLDFIAAVADGVAAVGGADLVVKMHPSESPSNRSEYQNLLERHASLAEGRWRVTQTESIYELMRQAVLVVSSFSTVLVEAALCDRMTLCVRVDGRSLPLPFVEQGLALDGGTLSEVAERVRMALCDPEVRCFAERCRQRYRADNPHLASPAAEQIAALLRSLIADRRKGMHGFTDGVNRLLSRRGRLRLPGRRQVTGPLP